MAAAVATTAALLPVLFLNHGGGPAPLMNDEMKRMMDHTSILAGWADHAAALRGRIEAHPRPIRAILVVSAHYEVKGERVPRAGGHAQPPMIYDYHGFPRAAYEFKYPARGDPALAEELVAAFKSAGFDQATVDPDRGLDHGVFVPLMKLFPDAAAAPPIVPVSVMKSQDVDEHLRLGRALAAFRGDCLILGSGGTTHNFAYQGDSDAGVFHDRLEEVLTTDGTMTRAERLQAMQGYLQWPDANAAQGAGSAEHFMPLIVALGAGIGALPEEDAASDRTAPGKVAHRTHMHTYKGDSTSFNVWFDSPEALAQLPRSTA